MGDPPDPRSDQFSFCVSLFEALFGRRPFGGSNCQALSANKQLGRHRTLPAHHAVPQWLVKAVLRGLSPSPHDRFDSMHALLAALLEPARRRPTSRALATGLALLVAGLGLGSVVPVSQSAAASASRAGALRSGAVREESGVDTSRSAPSRASASGSAWRRM